MKLTNTKSVRTKVLAGFLVVAALMGIIGAFAISRMAAISQRGHETYTENLVPVQHLASARAASYQVRVASLAHVIAVDPAEMDAQEAEITKQKAVVDEELAAYAPQTADAEVLAQVRAAWPGYVEVLESKLLPASRRLDTAEVVRIRKEELNPAYDRF